MKESRFIIPEYTTGQKIKRIRQELGLTQKEFAALVHVSTPTVERWESCRGPIKGVIVSLLMMLQKYPEYVESIRIPEKTLPLRLWYMHNQKVCTIIDVDEVNQQVKIANFTDNLMFRAFGVNKSPDFNRYREFLESRCFPRERDKMKLILKDLNLPFYDPFMIIKKTEGRMAEDDFWIKIER